MKIILNSINVWPKSIICDPGSEFKNVKFKKYLDNIGIKMIFLQSENKCSTVERFQKNDPT